MSRFFLLVMTLATCSVTLSAQDIIYKKDGKRLRVKVIEIDDTKIRYTEYTDQDGLVFSMDRSMIREIELESGNVYEEVEAGTDPSYYYDDAMSNIKINFLAIGNGDLILAYERALNERSGYEVTAKVYFNDRDFENDYGGGFGLQAGYKVKTGSVFSKGDYRPRHLLSGTYIRPGGGLSRRAWGAGHTTIVHAGIDLGRQFVYSDIFTLDLFLGFHYYANWDTGFPAGSTDRRFFDNEHLGGNLLGFDNRALAWGFSLGIPFLSQADIDSRGKKDGDRRGTRKRIN